MPAFRVRPSMLDAFKYYLDSDMSGDDFAARLDGVRQVTEQMAMGSAFHLIMERDEEPDRVLHQYHEAGVDWAFEFNLHDLRDAWRTLPPPRERVCEVEGEVEIEVPGFGSVAVAGHIDMVSGITGYDIKTSSRPRDIEIYIGASQWKAYSLIAGLSSFRYAAFVLRRHKSTPMIEVDILDQVTLTTYPRMEQDLADEIRHFLVVADLLGRLDLFKAEET